MTPPEQKKWSIGREIPIATIVVLVIQTVGVIWWAATISTEVKFMGDAMATNKAAQVAIERRQDDDWRRTEDRIVLRLDKVDAKLDRLIEHRK